MPEAMLFYFSIWLLFHNNIDNSARNVNLFHHIPGQLILHRLFTGCNGVLFRHIGRKCYNGSRLAVDLNGYLLLIVLHLLRITFRPLGMEYTVRAAQRLPQLFTEMRCKRS